MLTEIIELKTSILQTLSLTAQNFKTNLQNIFLL
jgi:hypothetical protein